MRKREGASHLTRDLQDQALRIYRVSTLSSPFGDAISSPSDMVEVIDINRNASKGVLKATWAMRRSAIQKTYRDISDKNLAMFRDSPPVIRRHTGTIDARLWSYLIRSFNLRHHYWAAQFVYGLPIMGKFHHSRLLETRSTSGDAPLNADTPHSLFHTAQARLLQRAKPKKPPSLIDYRANRYPK